MTKVSSHQVVILGAGRSHTGSAPSAMASVGDQHRLMDWLLAAFSVLPTPEILFVGGYKADAVEVRYPEVRYFFNPDWAKTGPARSLSLVPFSSGQATYVCYSDVVFRPDLVRRMEASGADFALAVDTRWRVRYDRRSRGDLDRAEKVLCDGDRVVDVGRQVPTSDADAEFAGLLKVRGQAAEALHDVIRGGRFHPRAGLPELIRLLHLDDLDPVAIDVHGDWAELNAPQDLARFVLGTKAESLERLKPLIRNGYIGDLVSFTHKTWQEDGHGIVERLRGVFHAALVIVRSSALNEDSWVQSAAGAYKSVANISVTDTKRLSAAIDEVFLSYGEPMEENQVLVQEMLRDVVMSGVIMTRTPSLGAPYYVINFDDTSARTDTVTAGDSSLIRTVFLYRKAEIRSDLPAELHRLMEMVAELERLVGHNSLDIEFGFTLDGRGHVLQVRPIAVSHLDAPVDDELVAQGVDDALRYYRELQKPSPFLLGRSTSFSVMTDWNPAEMIGTKPQRLAFSLYRLLITDEVWARQRAEYGYRDVRPSNLIVDFLGHPFVDVRADFNSFVPAALDDELASRLVEHYLDHLRSNPELHDKVEFEVLFTCLTFDFDQRVERLRHAGFSGSDIGCLREALRDVTRGGFGRCAKDLVELEGFRQRFDAMVAAAPPPLELAFLLLDDARRTGVPLFSHLARNAFVAVSLLHSLRAAGHLTAEEVEAFFASMRTVPSAMQEDAAQVVAGQMSWEELVAVYAHLRPGSYDITSPCYGDAPEEFLRPMLRQPLQASPRMSAAPWSESTRELLTRELAKLGLGVDAVRFESFLRDAIEGREFGKFAFMRHVNSALESLATFGQGHGVSREELSHVRIQDLLALRRASAENVRDHLQGLARAGREAFFVTQAVCLPSQIFSEEDFLCFEQLKAEPNFVTRLKVRAEVASLAGPVSPGLKFEDKIVLLPNADPGFDWIFSRRIAGLVTMYGGLNSHMAIRAAELRLPAAIGVGELLYDKIYQAQILELDCASRQIKVIR